MMRHLSRIVLVVICLCGGSLFAQQTRVVEGRTYMEHTVLAGQTLYAISRHYAVPVQAITAANPGATNGLSIGQVLLIPQDAVVKKEKKTAPALFAGELAHTVRRKETLYGIARAYGVEQDELVTRNPELAAGVKEGMLVIIPVAKVSGVSEVQTRPAVDDGATMHEVKPGETLYSLGQRYGVKAEAIEAANGGLPEGLKAGMFIRLPNATGPGPVSIKADSTFRRQRYEVALMLPFSIAHNDSLLASPEAKDYYSYTTIASQFHAGALMAIDSLEKLGLQANVGVYDMGTDARTWDPVLKRPELRNVDLFIGPFHRSAIEDLERVNKHGHVVCPVPQSNKVLLGHPNVSKVMSGRPDQLQQLARYVTVRFALENIILCRPAIPAEKDLQEQMLRALQQALGERPDRARDSVVAVGTDQRDINELQAKLDRAATNVIVVPSEDVESVTGIVRRLAALTEDHRIIVFGLNSWLEMETLEPQDMERVDLHVPASVFIDHHDPRVETFTRGFRDRFHTEPNDYAFLGFDVTMYYLTALMQEGTAFSERFAMVQTRPLHMRFHMVRAGMENGFRNESSLILEVQDMELRRAE